MTENNFLNDHCVLEIFEFLALEDLFNTLHVSLQFQRLTYDTFRSKHKNFKFKDHYSTVSERQLYKVFKTFGHLMTGLDTEPIFYPWYNMYIQTTTIDLINRYCRKSNRLRAIKMSYFNNIGQSLAKMKRVFANLHTLHLECVSLPYTIPQLLNLLPNAKEVTLLRCLDISLTSPGAEIKMSQIEKLHLYCFETLDVLSILPTLPTKFPNLRDLMFRVAIDEFDELNDDMMQNVARITTLKKLDINFTTYSLQPILDLLIANKINLISLQTNYAMFTNETVDTLCRMKSLNELIILNTMGITDIYIKKLVSSLKNLERFSYIKTGITGKCLLEIIEKSTELWHSEFRLRHDCIVDFTLCECISELMNGKRRNSRCTSIEMEAILNL